MMKCTTILFGAATLMVTPTLAAAQTAPGNGQFNGVGFNHMNSGNATGQPDQTCQDLIADGTGATPGNSGSSPGGGSPFDFAITNSGAQYAGSQPQNSRNTASASQYDVACLNQMPN